MPTNAEAYELHLSCHILARAVEPMAHGFGHLKYTEAELATKAERVLNAIIPAVNSRATLFKHLVPFQLPGDPGWYVFYVREGKVYGIGYGDTPDAAKKADPFPPGAMFL